MGDCHFRRTDRSGLYLLVMFVLLSLFQVCTDVQRIEQKLDAYVVSQTNEEPDE